MDLSVEDVLRKLRDHEGPVLLDLDETAYLRNSTEDFLDSVRPRLAVWLVLKVLDVLKPWKNRGGEIVRDTLRVNTILKLFPWGLRAYERRVARLAASHENRELLEASRSRGREPYIVTLGYEPIVLPLVRALGLREDRVVACGLRPEDRLRGKLALTRDRLPEVELGKSAFVTDSEMDRPLLDACGLPLLVRFSNAKYVRALGDVYLPGRYLSEVKRPGERYIWRGILQDDFAFWVLASFSATRDWLRPLSLLLLLLSFWAAYEIGYVENDVLGVRFEESPKVSKAFFERSGEFPSFLPWLWVMFAGLAGVVLTNVHASFGGISFDRTSLLSASNAAKLGAWFALVVGVRGLFWIYNRLDKFTRVWLFLGLQMARSFAFVAVVPVGLAGALGLTAHTLSRWFPYFAYRYSRDWTKGPTYLSRLALLVAISLCVSPAVGFGWTKDATWWLLFGWCLFRGRRELLDVVRRAKRIDRDSESARS